MDIVFKILGMGTLILGVTIIVAHIIAFINEHDLQWIYFVLGLIILLGTLGCYLFGLF